MGTVEGAPEDRPLEGCLAALPHLIACVLLAVMARKFVEAARDFWAKESYRPAEQSRRSRKGPD